MTPSIFASPADMAATFSQHCFETGSGSSINQGLFACIPVPRATPSEIITSKPPVTILFCLFVAPDMASLLKGVNFGGEALKEKTPFPRDVSQKVLKS